MTQVSFRKLSPNELWTLKGSGVSVGIEKKTGFIRSLRFARQKVDLFEIRPNNLPGYIGGLRIFDERDRRWYSDQETPFTLSKAGRVKGGVRFRKQFRGAPFVLDVALRFERGMLYWEVEARKTMPRVADRSLRVYFQMPLLAGWDLWAPCKGGNEITFDGMTGFEFMYLQVPWVSDYEVILPMVSHYHRGLDAGYSMILPIDDPVPAAKFQFANGEKCFNWGSGGAGNFAKTPAEVPHLEAVNYYIGLVKDRPMRTRVALAFHEGCWRPALGQVFRRWNKFFVPDNPRFHDFEGVFTCTSVAPRDAKAAAKAHVTLVESHGHFENYSVYWNEKPKWMKNSIKETLWRVLGGMKNKKADPRVRNQGPSAWDVQEWMETHSDREIAAAVAPKRPDHRPPGAGDDVAQWTDAQVDEFLYWTRERIRNLLRAATKEGMHCHWYFNYSDGFRPTVETNWPDAIACNEQGEPMPSGWQMCHNMNCDPQYSFGKYLIACAKRIVEDYPEIKGFFLDCFRHYEIDFAHDDGVTVVNHKPAYSINFSYDRLEPIVKRILRAKNMCTFANKPQTIRTMRWVDGMMLEGSGDQFEEKYFYSALAKPIIFLWTHTTRSTDEMYRRSVLHGCFPRHVGTKREDIKLLERYLPLFEACKRRVFCFEPDPIRAPRGSRCRIFTVGNDYLATIANVDLGPGDKVKWAKDPYAVFRVQRGHDVSRVGVMYPGDKRWRIVKPRFNGTFMVVPLKEYQHCAVVRLFVTRKTRKQIGKEQFPKDLDLQPDPESAFESLASL